MIPHAVFTVHEATQVGEVRRHAAGLATALGFGEVAAGRLALLATELGTNLYRHARDGRLLMARRDGPAGVGIELLSLDSGPGMADVETFMADGFSTAGSAGTGLGAIRRLADEFDLFSAPGRGTVLLARIHATSGTVQPRPDAASKPLISFAGLCTAAPGETVSGDAWCAVQQAELGVMMVADGLGHGPAAAEAADAALALFGAQAFSVPDALLERAHDHLRGTRGAALSFARLDAAQGRVAFCGAGNVVGRIISGVEDRSMLPQHGTAGLQIRRPQSASYAWPEHAIVVLHSDGLISRWNLKDTPGLLRCDPAVIAGWLLREHSRGRDDATVLVARRAA